jgi:non-ribosomal peptide synthase protein (TIGR01720 family)
VVSDAVVLTVEGHGREEQVLDGTPHAGVDLSRTVGWFTTMYPIRIDLTDVDAETVLARRGTRDLVIDRAKAARTAHPDNGIGYGLLRHLDEVGASTLSRHPEPQIVFNYVGSVGAADVRDLPEGLGWTPELGDEGGGLDQDALGGAAPVNRMPAQAEIDLQSVQVDGPDGPVVRVYASFLGAAIDRSDFDELAQWWLEVLRLMAETD